MKELSITLENLDQVFPDHFTQGYIVEQAFPVVPVTNLDELEHTFLLSVCFCRTISVPRVMAVVRCKVNEIESL